MNIIFKDMIILILSLFLFSCTSRKEIKHSVNSESETGNTNVYRCLLEERYGYKIWIVDGTTVRREIFPEFLFGGNSERYTFNPEDEIWIDNSITSEELETTIEHEINERNLMHNFGMTYFDAHDSSLSIEVIMRKNFIQKAKEHEKQIPLVSPIDFDSTQEIADLPEKIKLNNIYRQFYKTIEGFDIWIVDGVNIRRDIYPDFGFSGNYLAYKFIPENEIWIDAQISFSGINLYAR